MTMTSNVKIIGICFFISFGLVECRDSFKFNLKVQRVPALRGFWEICISGTVGGPLLKFIYSEKATKFCEISTNYLTGST